jgi:hypothetical protein
MLVASHLPMLLNPQAVINMNNCFEVAEADSISGNEHSLAIVAPDGIHFVKGTCREEVR